MASAAAAAFSYLSSAFATVSLASVGQAAFQAAVAFGVQQVVRNNTRRENNGNLISLALAPNEPRRLLCGTRATGGLMVDWFTRGSKNQYLYVPIYLSDGPCQKITKIWSGGREVWFGNLTNGQRIELTEFNSGGPRCYVTFHSGSHTQAADPTLRAQFPSEWPATSAGKGCTYVMVEYVYDDNTMVTPVDLTFELQGAAFYDRRKDSTAGGSGSHRIDNAATWDFSDNPAVILDHYLLGRLQGGRVIWGLGLDPEDVPYERFSALANLCDEQVSVSTGGTQLRYRANGFLFSDLSHEETIRKLCRAMNADPSDFMGRVGINDRQAKTPVLTIDDADVIAGSPISYKDKRSSQELVNEVTGFYADPADLYNERSYPTVSDATWLAEDGDTERSVSLDLQDFETDQERAQRLAWLFAKHQRRQAILAERYPRWAVELEQGDWFTRTGDRFGDGKTFQVESAALDPATWTVLVVSREVDPADVAWTTNIASPAPPASVPSNLTSITSIPAPDITVTAVELTSNGAKVPGVRLDVNLPNDLSDVIAYETEMDYGIRTPNSGVGIFDQAAPNRFYFDALTPQLEIIGFLPLQEYAFRFRGRRGAWVGDWGPWQYVETTASLGANSVSPGAVLWEDIVNLPLTLADLDEAANAQLVAATSTIADLDLSFPRFSIVGGVGSIAITANDAGSNFLRVSEGVLEHPSLGELTFTQADIATPWGTFFRPPGGSFVLVYSEEAVSTRFANGAGTGNLFTAVYDGGIWTAYNTSRNKGETFDPRPTDMILAKAVVEPRAGDPTLSKFGGISEVTSYVRETQVRSRVTLLEATIGTTVASVQAVEQAQADADLAFASFQTSTLAALADKASVASVTAVSNSLATTDSAFAAFETETDANFATVNANITSVQQSSASTALAVSNLETTVTAANNGFTASITQNATAISQLDGTVAALYTLNVQANNRIGGLLLVGSNQGVSAFWDVDEFRIGSLSVPGDAPFKVIGNQVIIKSAFIGELDADVIDVRTLNADRIVVGSITVTEMEQNAVNDPVSSVVTSTRAISGTASWTTVDTLTAVSNGGEIETNYLIDVQTAASGSADIQLEARILRAGAQQKLDVHRFVNNFRETEQIMEELQNVPSGSWNWELQVRALRLSSGVAGVSILRSNFRIKELRDVT